LPGQGEEVGRYLESRLSIPVKVRSFASEDQLYKWLVHSREVDVAWLSKSSLAELPAGQLYSLAENRDPSSGLLPGEIVVRPEMNADLRQQLRAAFLNMHDSSPGQALLAKLGIGRFVSPSSQEASSSVDTSMAVSQQQIIQQEEPDPMQPVDVVESLPSSVVEVKSKQAPSATPSPEFDPKTSISLVSDYLAYNSEDDIYEARGDVVLRKAGVELKADELLWQATTQDAAAQGSVQLNDDDTEISGERLQYNVATGQGQIHDGQVFVPEGNFHLAGKQIEKHSRINYFVKDGTFTTCDGEIPDWKFSASEVDVTLGGHAKAKDVWFYIRDVPVLYSPYLEFPVQTERESGFLMPAFGYSDTKGMRASVAWYQVIDRHLDATIYLDYLSDIGLGKGLEYRYALAHQNNGKALYYHVTGLKGTSDLFYLKWGHRGELPADWRLTADIEYTDRKLFFEEFGDAAEDYNRDKTVSTLILQRNWQKLNLVGYARYIKDLETDNDETLQRLPELGLNLARYRLGDTPFYVDLESYATRFQRDSGVDGERLYLRPSLSAVYKPGLWLEIVPEAAFYERLYNTDARGDEKFIPEFSLTLATRLVKNLDVNRWDIERIQHSIEPKAVYTYVPDESQDDLPLFDLFDRIVRRNDVVYALVNRLTARSTAADGSRVYREILNLRISQRYDIDEARNNRSGENQPLSDLRVELDLQPTRNISLDAESLIPVYGNDGFRTLRVGTSVRDNTGNAVKIDYSYEDIDFGSVATDFIRFQLDTSILKPVYASFVERYDFRDGRALEKTIGLEYRSKCWSIFMSYRNRYREDSEDDNEFMMTFVLAGLGQDKGFGYGFGTVNR
jgi:LPS-assembly protein